MSEKTEKPTPKKIRDARKEGQVARSAEVESTVQLFIIVVWFLSMGDNLYNDIGDLLKSTLTSILQPQDEAFNIFKEHFYYVFVNDFVPLFCTLIIASFISGFLQTGFLFALKSIKPSAKKMNVLSNLKNWFSFKNLFELIKNVIKLLVLVIVVGYLIKQYSPSFSRLINMSVDAGFYVANTMLKWIMEIVLIVGLIFSVMDYFVQKKQLNKKLMMSKEDIKKEYKDSEGDQEIKQKRKQFHQEIQSGSLAGKVSKSTLVVKNPTHIAVCIRYVPGETPLPKIMEYGYDAMALHIIDLAEKNNITVVENIPLARAIVSKTVPGDFIPRDLYEPIAKILNELENLK